MLSKNDIVLGQYIWWTADRMFKAWDCPGKIIGVSRDDFGEPEKIEIQTYDDFKTVTIMANGECTRDELRTVEFSKVRGYIRKRIADLDKKIIDLSVQIEELEELKTDLKGYIEI